MNCTNLNTAAEILEAFRACNNPGEEIELFECLATRPDPPVGAFVEIVRNIKLEAVLALTIQAFGKITDADIKARLKESQDLLTMLSQQAQSGSSDLIRWSAATTIDNLGFEFIYVSQYLSEEPKKISEKIVQSKVKRFGDLKLRDSYDYDEFLRFWIYADREKLREITRNSPELKKINNLKASIDETLNEIRSINENFYQQNLVEVNLGSIPQINIEDGEALVIFNNYQQSLSQKLSILNLLNSFFI